MPVSTEASGDWGLRMAHAQMSPSAAFSRSEAARSPFEVFAGGRNETPYGRYFHLAVRVDSCDEAFAAARKAGARVKSEPRDTDIPSRPEIYPVRIAFVYGPDGEEIEFFQIRG